MAVSFRSASNTGNSTQVSTVNVPVPAGAAAGDIAVIHLGCWQSGSTPTYTPPAGFTQKAAFTSGDGAARNTIWWKRLTAADTGNYSFGLGASFWTTGICALFTGCPASGDPWDAIATAVTGTFGSITALSVGMSSAGGGLFWCCYNDTAGAHTPPTNFTEIVDVDCASAAYRLPGAAGTQSASGASIASSSSAAAWLGSLLDGSAAPRTTVDLTHVGSSAWVAPASSTTISPTYPTGLQQGDAVYTIIHLKPDTATVATPTDWTLIGSVSGGGGSQNAGTGPTRIHVYRRIVPAGGLTGTQAFTLTNGSSPTAHMQAYRASGTNLAYEEALTSWSVATGSTTVGGTCSPAISIGEKDQLEITLGLSDDQPTASGLAVTGISATGMTIAGLASDPASGVINAQGNDSASRQYHATVTAGTPASVAPVVTATSSTAETAVGLVLRVRATVDADTSTPISDADTAGSAEAEALAATRADADTAATGEAETVAATRVDADTAGSAEGETVARASADADTAGSAETETVEVAPESIADADTAGSAETETLAATRADADTAGSVDTDAVGYPPFSDADTASTVEAETVAAALTAPDTSTAVETETGGAPTTTETWTAGNGTPWPATWSATNGAAATQTIEGGKGRLVPSGGWASAYWTGSDTWTDFDVTVSFTATSGDAVIGIAPAHTSWVTPDSSHYLYCEAGASEMGYVSLRRSTGGHATLDSEYAGAAPHGTNGYTARLQRVGTTLRAKVWTAGGTEPSSWLVEATDASPPPELAGKVFLGAATTVDWDDLSIASPELATGASDADTSAAIEAETLTVSFSDADVSAAVDAENAPNVTRTDADTVSAVEGEAITVVLPADADTASTVEGEAATSTIGDADVAASAEAEATSAVLADVDVATSAETDASGVLLVDADTSVADDQVALTGLSDADVAATVEAETVAALLGDGDTASSAETETASVNPVDADSAATVETEQAAVQLSDVDTAATVEGATAETPGEKTDGDVSAAVEDEFVTRTGAGGPQAVGPLYPTTEPVAATGTTWTTTTNALGSTQGTNAVFTNAANGGTGTLTLGGYGADAQVPADATVDTVTLTLRFFVGHTARWTAASCTVQLFAGTTALGSPQAVGALPTTATDRTITFSGANVPSRAQLTDLRLRVTAVHSGTSSSTFNVDTAGVTLDVTAAVTEISHADTATSTEAEAAAPAIVDGETSTAVEVEAVAADRADTDTASTVEAEAVTVVAADTDSAVTVETEAVGAFEFVTDADVSTAVEAHSLAVTTADPEVSGSVETDAVTVTLPVQADTAATVETESTSVAAEARSDADVATNVETEAGTAAVTDPDTASTVELADVAAVTGDADTAGADDQAVISAGISGSDTASTAEAEAVEIAGVENIGGDVSAAVEAEAVLVLAADADTAGSVDTAEVAAVLLEAELITVVETENAFNLTTAAKLPLRPSGQVVTPALVQAGAIRSEGIHGGQITTDEIIRGGSPRRGGGLRGGPPRREGPW